MKIRNYKFDFDGEYIIGFHPPYEGEEVEYVGQMGQHMEVVESIQYGGYYKFINGEFILDEERKSEMLKKWEEEHKDNVS